MKIATFLPTFACLGWVASSPVRSPVPTVPISTTTTTPSSPGAISFVSNTPADPSWDFHDPHSGASTLTPTQEHNQDDSEPIIMWDPPRVHRYRRDMKEKIQDACRQALWGKDCERAIIYAGHHREGDRKTERKYFKVSVWTKGDKSDRGRIMRVYYDGSTRFDPRDAGGQGGLHGDNFRYSQKRKSKVLNPGAEHGQGRKRIKGNGERTGISELREHDRDVSEPRIVWKPPDSHKRNLEFKRKIEDYCRQALRGKDCETATIHAGIHREKRLGSVSRYFKVSVPTKGDDSDKGSIMRLFLDGSSRWNPKDADGKGHLLGSNLRYKQRLRLSQIFPEALTEDGPRFQARPIKNRKDGKESSTGVADEHTEKNTEPRFLWDRPSSHKYRKDRKRKLEEACRKALDGEDCETATIHEGLHREQTAWAMRKYLSVSVRRKDDDADAPGRYMRLYTDRSSHWHPQDAKSSVRIHDSINRKRKRKSSKPDTQMHTVRISQQSHPFPLWNHVRDNRLTEALWAPTGVWIPTVPLRKSSASPEPVRNPAP